MTAYSHVGPAKRGVEQSDGVIGQLFANPLKGMESGNINNPIIFLFVVAIHPLNHSEYHHQCQGYIDRKLTPAPPLEEAKAQLAELA